MVGYGESHSLAMYRTRFEIPYAWRAMPEYSKGLYQLAEMDHECLDKKIPCVPTETLPSVMGRHEDDFHSQVYGFEPGCPESRNIVIGNLSDAKKFSPAYLARDGTSDSAAAYYFNLPSDDDGYVVNHGVSHMYGPCGSCQRSSQDAKRPAIFDVAMYERLKGRNVSLHNCFVEVRIRIVTLTLCFALLLLYRLIDTNF